MELVSIVTEKLLGIGVYVSCDQLSVPIKDMLLSLCINVVMSVVGFSAVIRTIPLVSSMFIDAGLFGRDLCKKERDKKVPESMGMVSGSVYLITMFLFLGVPFGHHFINRSSPFPHAVFAEYLTSLLSICCMLFLGFADDVLNLKWRYKLVLPTLASLPLLMVYYINMGSTTVVVPKPLRAWIGLTLNIGPLYYIYMSMLAVFCTNAINIYAGINGLESGQAIVISASVAAFNLVELGGYQSKFHYFSLCLIIPFLATSLGLYFYNRSTQQFIFNFLYSTPFKLFHLFCTGCPRLHRLPRYNPDSDKLEPSIAEFKTNAVRKPVLSVLRILSRFGVVHLKEGLGEDGDMCTINNLTLINLALLKLGPQHEGMLTTILLLLQVLSSCLAFFIRYPLADLFF
ncbi:LOW QUALITY PROTEIN: UDP-N-acetylglucosamine--dolichyl-phosphate N-acetylglucosaminephosphotransferase [Macrobrachium rosenbergii]|uniref:LOW QUALITY PROTEIN: UDP-N-acetylglucosamine--dolichyl-phosphate N-acetylglucosaminephosphotransferase n=1 Tax=Macrobrachium rosenbergii TaxID=79674 RepID=UPI0034D48A56